MDKIDKEKLLKFLELRTEASEESYDENNEAENFDLQFNILDQEEAIQDTILIIKQYIEREF